MLTAFAQLPAEHRFLFALGLLVPDDPPEPPPRSRGRPPVLASFTERIRAAQAIRKIENSLAREGETTGNPAALKPILNRIGRLHDKGGVLPFQINRHSLEAGRLSTEADRLGRFHSTEILKPTESEPEINKLAAKQLAPQFPGLTDRMVRSIRGDERLEEFLPQPAWVLPEWEKKAALRFRAGKLLTPEYLAKIEVTERRGLITVLDDLDRISLSSEQYRKAREFQSHCYALGIRNNALTLRGGSAVSGNGQGFQNLVLSKIGRGDAYNRAIIARVGLRGLQFLRAALWEYDLTDAGWTLAASSPEEARHLALNLLRRLLDRIP